MAERPRIPLSFGGGMDRATGVFDVGPENFLDLRNVYLYRNRMEARKGLAAVNTFVDDAAAVVDDVVLISPMRSEQMGVVIGYQDGDRELHVYRVDGDGTGTDRIGAWGTLPASAHEPPRVLATESYRKLFFAHDEVVFSRRLSTYYYDPFVGSPLVQLTADLDGAGDAPVYFRGVARHLNYVIGWGFGTATEQNRPEIVRVSMPAAPTSWDAEHYFIAGIRDDPVLDCQSMGATPSPLAVFKQSETYTIFGFDRRTFGIRRIDDIYGLAASRLAITVNGVCYFWSLEGPRATSGNSPSKDLAWPLDLDAPAPATLVAEGALEDGFVEYLPGRRVILFVFGKRVYALSIWNPADPKWSYGELGYEVFCGGRLSSGGTGQSVPPTAAPSAVSGTGKGGTTDTLTVDWTNNSIDGDEYVEVWLKPTGGSWARHASVLATGATQNTDVASLGIGVTHEISLRYRRGPYYSPNSSDSSDPSAWPAPQQGTGSTLINAPTMDSTSWTRVDAGTERNVLNWTNTHPTLQTKIYRGGALIDTVAAGVATYNDEAMSGEASHTYKLKHTSDVDSAFSNSIIQWAGPDLPPTPTILTSQQGGVWMLTWTNGDASLETELWKRNVTLAESHALEGTAGSGATNSSDTETGTEGQTVAMAVRHKKTEFAVDDFSPWNGGSSSAQADEIQAVVAAP